MRLVLLSLPVAALAAVSACAPATRWEKPQASAEAATTDLEQCRLQARQEALRQVGPYPLGYPFYGPSPYRLWRYEHQTRLQQELWFTENRLTSFCMRNKGYDRVAVEDQKS